MIFGNKNIFAIQFESPSSAKSKVSFWLEGNKIGNSQEFEFVKQVYSQFHRLLELSNTVCFEGEIDSGYDIDFLIKNEAVFENQTILNIGESFDDFIIRVMFDKQSIYFFWKLVAQPFFDYEDSIHRKTFSSTVPIKLFEKTLKQIKVFQDGQSLAT